MHSRTINAWLLVGLLPMLLGCQSGPRPPSIAEQAQTTPLPVTEEGRQADCNNIRMAIANEQSRAQMARVAFSDPMAVMGIQRYAMTNIAALENRASMENCRAAFR